jgi:hypothetical protein
MRQNQILGIGNAHQVNALGLYQTLHSSGVNFFPIFLVGYTHSAPLHLCLKDILTKSPMPDDGTIGNQRLPQHIIPGFQGQWLS